VYNCQLHAQRIQGKHAVWKAKNADGVWVDHVEAEVMIFSGKTKKPFLYNFFIRLMSSHTLYLESYPQGIKPTFKHHKRLVPTSTEQMIPSASASSGFE
jgi:hypothetical protein